MTGRQRIRAVIAGEIPDRVPVAVLATEHQATVAGIPLGDLYTHAEKALAAWKKTLQVYEGVDMAFAPETGIGYLAPFPDSHSSWFFKWVLPTAGSDEIPQMIEDTIISGDQYPLLREKGLLYFLRPDRPDMDAFLAQVAELGRKQKEIEEILEAKQLWNYGSSVISVATDLIANLRGLQGYLTDFIDRPDELLKTAEWLQPSMIKAGLQVNIFNNPDNTLVIGANRCSSTYLSPTMFRKFIEPLFKKVLNTVLAAGKTPVLHLDGNWTPMAEWFLEMPPHKMIFHLDDTNDIRKWKKVLKNHSALMGNVPASLLSHSTPQKVADFCKKLIEDIGDGGGFVLCNACSMPLDGRVENVRAMIETAHEYGRY